MAMRIVGRERRKLRIRKKLSGTVQKPRLTVFRTARHIYAQVIDDASGRTLAHASTLSKDLKGSLDEGNKTEAAKNSIFRAVRKMRLALEPFVEVAETAAAKGQVADACK